MGPVYLLDAAAEMMLLAGWVVALSIPASPAGSEPRNRSGTG